MATITIDDLEYSVEDLSDSAKPSSPHCKQLIKNYRCSAKFSDPANREEYLRVCLARASSRSKFRRY